MTHNKDFYFVHCNGERKQEGVNNLNGFILCSFRKVSITNVRDKQQRRVFLEFIYWCTWKQVLLSCLK